MKRLLVTGSAVAMLAFAGETSAQAAELVEAWRTSGFDMPESVTFDDDTNAYYVSNQGTDSTSKDGDGFISKLNADGSVAERAWVTGLNSPKGSEVVGDRLFIADIDELVEVDLATGDVVSRYPVEAAEYLNDLAVAVDGRIFMSDTVGNAIYLFDDGEVSLWLKDEGLAGPDGLAIDRTDLVVATSATSDGTPGNVKAVDLLSRQIEDFGAGVPIGDLDGIQPSGDGSVIVTDNPGGRILEVMRGEEAEVIADVEPGAASHELVPNLGLLILPQTQDNVVVAYNFE